MSRGGGSGKGRNRRGGLAADFRSWAREGVERHGPVTEERRLYPPNPHLGRAPCLSSNMASLVLIRRLLTNYWRSSESHVVEQTSQPEVVKYTDVFTIQTCDLEAQKDTIISHCGKEYFPAELLQPRLLRPLKGTGKGGVQGDTRRQRLKEMEQKETESNTADEKQKGQAFEEKNADDFVTDELEDLVGDDYAHDYYADEELDDHLEDGDDTGILGS